MADIKDLEELEIPEFLSNNDEDDIHDEMLAVIPDEYDKSEGGHLWNFTRPTALIVSQLRGFDLPNAINLIWPRFSSGEYVDLHAELRNMTRKEALYATGEITITGTPETVIPAGYSCATESKNDVASKSYVTTEECEIGEDGTVTVHAQAAVAGSDGNTAANTIVINSSGYDDVTGITNEASFTGGVDEEDDESLIERIREYDQMQGVSNIGNPSDYKRWAKSVPGTGTANIIRATDTSGLVTIVLTDGNGEPASEALCTKVYNYIMSPDDEQSRLAPCGANLSVVAPTTTTITIAAAVTLTSGTVESITAVFVSKLNDYFSSAVDDGEIRYQKIGNILGDIEGVYDFSGLYVNSGMANIPLSTGFFPYTSSESVTLTLEE
jgi:uncharacterized phage protein gp47/JayE